MLKKESNDDVVNNWAQPCQSAVNCRAQYSSYLSRQHGVCESCERAPAALLCKADAASLCTSCDADIHSANPLARRHHRIPINPSISDEDDEDEAASWLLLNPLAGEEDDQYLDYNSTADHHFAQHRNNNNYEVDRLVPIQKLHFTNEYESSKTAYTYDHAVSVSSLDIGVVPESTVSEISISHARPPKGTIDLFSGSGSSAPQLPPLDREARVLRYRQKKKNRKFEKTIRYASRKAYAETRPRIKGRFAKRSTAVEVEVDQMFSTTMMAENHYNIVPSF